jgi:hypothetical protein
VSVRLVAYGITLLVGGLVYERTAKGKLRGETWR